MAEKEPFVEEWELKLMRKISRELNVIPPNKTMRSKKEYRRNKRSTREWLEEAEDEDGLP